MLPRSSLLKSRLAPQQVPLGPGLWTARAMEGTTCPTTSMRRPSVGWRGLDWITKAKAAEAYTTKQAIVPGRARPCLFRRGGRGPLFGGFSGLIIPLRHSIGFAGSAEGGGTPTQQGVSLEGGGAETKLPTGQPPRDI
jgi:hypothetical protein